MIELAIGAVMAAAAIAVTTAPLRATEGRTISGPWRQLARRYGWSYVPGFGVRDPRLSGQIRGVDFQVRANVPTGRAYITSPLPAPVLAALPGEPNQPLSARAVAFLLTQNPTDAAERALRSLYGPPPGWLIEDGQLHWQQRGFSADRMMAALQAFADIALALDELGLAEWQAVARAHDLRITNGARREDCTLRGDVDGHTVRVGVRADPLETILRVRIGAPWPDDALLQPRKDPQGSGVPLANPILNGLVRARASDPELLRKILSDADVIGDLLAVLHPYPRSSVVKGHVQMHCPGRPDGQLQEQLTDALTLARRLQEAAQRMAAQR